MAPVALRGKYRRPEEADYDGTPLFELAEKAMNDEEWQPEDWLSGDEMIAGLQDDNFFDDISGDLFDDTFL
jgi:hypothetical protein